MASSDNISMAVFCDFENVALGVRDANYEKFDIKPVLERLLLKGSIVVKKAYCDWDRYKTFKAPMHEANFELIEIPHVRQSGKNSADIRLVVDALDLCYTKSHVDTFVIISGDSDFSPLVSKLRENAKRVIGVGVKQSTSDLLVANCDEFIFYDDLVREVRRAAAKRKEELDARRGQPAARRPSDDKRREELEARKAQALEMVVETFDALVLERGDTGKIWASLLKDTLKRRRPDFSETFYGFRTFGNLLEEAQARGLFDFGRDEKSGTYVFRSAAAPVAMPAPELVVVPETPAGEEAAAVQGAEEAPVAEAKPERGRRGRGGRGGRGRDAAPAVPELSAADAALAAELPPVPAITEEAATEAPPAEEAIEPADIPAADIPAEPEPEPEPAPAPVKERRRAPRKPAAKKVAADAAPAVEAAADLPAPAVVLDSAEDTAATAPEPAADTAADTVPDTGEAAEADTDAKPARKKAARPSHKAPARKSAPRGRRPAKPKTTPENG
jgi:uncharacterized LabA/DUF88 family protein